MANQEHLDILKQGVEVWNQWRQEHRDMQTDLSGSNLSHTYFRLADFFATNLTCANLSGANLNAADLRVADLISADLSGADLAGANISHANLSHANISHAIFNNTCLNYSNLTGTDLSEARIGWTTLNGVDLRTVTGLETVNHKGPSSIGIDTIYLSQGQIPESFLRQAGVPETFITNIRALVKSMRPIDFYSCFISYSTKDQDFAERLYADLQNKGVRCWFAQEDMKIGDKIWRRIDESIRLYDKLLVVLSQNSVDSEWVEREVMAALEKEKQQKKLVLFPVTVDEAFKRTDAPWAADIRRSRHVGDFRNWKSHDEYQKAFDRLLRDLKSEAQKMASQDSTTNGGEG